MDLRVIPYNIEPEFSEEEFAALERATTVADDTEPNAMAAVLLLLSYCCSGSHFDLLVVDLTDTNLDDHECITEHLLFDMIVVTVIS